MIRKFLSCNRKRSGTVLLNSILVMSVAIMVVGYTNSYISEQINDYRRLDEIYKQQINNKINKSNKIEYWENRNP